MTQQAINPFFASRFALLPSTSALRDESHPA